MFSVVFEVRPRAGQRDAYLGSVKMVQPEIERAPGFVDNIRYRSLTRDGWILSLSSWRDEESLVRRRTGIDHEDVHEKDRSGILDDYHFRAGPIAYDTRLPDRCELSVRRIDEADAGEDTAITLIDAGQARNWVESHNAQEIALYLGFDLNSYGDCISWDVFDSLLIPGEIILLVLWKDQEAAMRFARSAMVPDDSRVRMLRVVRDYAMLDRREAPQYFPDAADCDILRA